MPRLPFSAQWVRQLLINRLGDRSPNVGLVLTDLQSGAKVTINPDEPYRAASVAKIPVAMTVLNLVTQGALSLTDEIIYRAATDFKAGAGSLQYTLQDGDPVSVGYLLDRLIRVSDNIAWRMFERYLGAEQITQYLRAQGVTSPYIVEFPVFTARELDRLLTRLDAGEAGISPELTRLLIDLMATTVFRDRIPAKLPPEAYAATKVGTLEGYVHDVGLVYAPQRSFVLTVFTEGIPEPEAIALIADLAATIYWYQDYLVRAANG